MSPRRRQKYRWELGLPYTEYRHKPAEQKRAPFREVFGEADGKAMFGEARSPLK